MSEMAIEGAATGATPGAQLQTARQDMGWTVEQVAEQLKWAPRQVLALEAGDYQALPGMATVRGFLRAYAKLVRLDPAPLVAQYDRQNGTVAEVLPVRRELATPFSEVRLPSMHKRGLSGASWAIIGALVLLVCVLIASHMGWLKPLPSDLFGRKPGMAASQLASAGTSPTASAESAGNSAASVMPPVISTFPPNGATPAPGPDSPRSASEPAAAVTTVTSPPAVTTQPLASAPSAAPGTTSLPLAGQGTAPATANAARTPTPAPAATVSPAPVAGAARQPSPVPAAAGALRPSAAAQAGAATPTPAGVTASGNPATGTGGALVLKFRQDCWVEVKRVNGNVLLSRLLKAGETETLPMNEPVQLVVGNVAGVDATLRGQPLVLKNAAGNTARVILK